jgi:hypothetical protein
MLNVFIQCMHMLSGWCHEATSYSTERNTGFSEGAQQNQSHLWRTPFKGKGYHQEVSQEFSVLRMLLHVAHGPGAIVLSTTRILRLLGPSVWVLVLSGT